MNGWSASRWRQLTWHSGTEYLVASQQVAVVPARGKRSTEISSEKQFALIGEPRRKIYRKTGGNTLVRVLSENRCTVNGKDGKSTVATITNVVKNDANPNYTRRNILTKGAIVDTNKGQVKITSRPGHDGVLNGVVL